MYCCQDSAKKTSTLVGRWLFLRWVARATNRVAGASLLLLLGLLLVHDSALRCKALRSASEARLSIACLRHKSLRRVAAVRLLLLGHRLRARAVAVARARVLRVHTARHRLVHGVRVLWVLHGCSTGLETDGLHRIQPASAAARVGRCELQGPLVAASFNVSGHAGRPCSRTLGGSLGHRLATGLAAAVHQASESNEQHATKHRGTDDQSHGQDRADVARAARATTVHARFVAILHTIAAGGGGLGALALAVEHDKTIGTSLARVTCVTGGCVALAAGLA